jgi:hypothetical protein
MRLSWVVLRVVVLGVVVLGALPRVGLAQEPDYASARMHYKAGLEAQAAGDFETAAKEFVAAYDITKDPKVFYQIARAYEAAGNKEAAVIYYRRYVASAKPSDKDVADVKVKIEALEAVGTGGAAAPPSETTAPEGGSDEALPPAAGDQMMPLEGLGGEDEAAPAEAPKAVSTDETTRWKRTAAWVSVATAVGCLAAGAVLTESAVARGDDLGVLADHRDMETGKPTVYTGATQQEYEDREREGSELERYATVAFLGAGLATGAALVLFMLDRGDKSHGEAAAATSWRVLPIVGLGSSTAGASAEWVF